MSSNRQPGFTLVELLVTLVVISILLSIAFPSYRQYVIRGKRTAAQAAMMDIANREQQFLLANRAYADKATLEANGYLLPVELTDSYSWDVVPGDGASPSYVITFTSIGGQASDGELALTSAGDRTPAEKWHR